MSITLKKDYHSPSIEPIELSPLHPMLNVVSLPSESGGGTHEGTGEEEELVKDESFKFEW